MMMMIVYLFNKVFWQ